MEQSRLRELEDQCIQECQPPCTARCPVHVDVRALTSAISAKETLTANKVLRKTIPFPEIIARTCDQPCQQNCYRKTKGGAIEIAALELFCLQHNTEPHPKPLILPKKNASVAIVGAGLSGLTAAYDLAKKGYQVSLFDAEGYLGGRLWQFPDDQLPREVIVRETNVIADLGVEIHLNELVDTRFIADHPFDAWFLDIGVHGLLPTDLDRNDFGRVKVDANTFQTSQTNFFSVNQALDSPSTILAVSEGRRAAISMDRFLQNVSLTASRVNEGAYDTRLVTQINKVETNPSLRPTLDTYTPEEALVEANRCLQCDCMECVKVCEYLRHYGSYPKKYIREIYNNLSIIMRTRTANKMINSCTLCGLCAEVCPTDLNMGQVNYEVRQTMVKTGKMPISAHDFALRDMAFSNGERASLTLIPENKGTCQDLFFPGCQLSASNPEYIPQLYQVLSAVLPDLGVMLRCCGAPADWSGEQTLFEQTMQEYKSVWQKYGQPRLVLACSSCQRVFNKFLPEAETISVWELFDQHELFPSGIRYDRPLTIHDPCTSRHEEKWQNAVRVGLDRMGVPFHELEMSRSKTECCGYGGVAWLAHPELVKDILKRRVQEDEADYLTYCVMCRDLLAGEGKPTLHLLDMLFGNDLDQLAQRKGPDYSQRHENRLRAKLWMQKLFTGKDSIMPESYEAYPLILSPELRSLIESRLILIEDIQKVIEHAETTGEYFINHENQHSLASFKPNLITYWVDYTRTAESYLIHDAYSHRMELEGEKTNE